MSAAYIGKELESEFGKIPPSFLPLGNRRLFQHQMKSAPKNSKVYISLPESYIVSNIDKRWFEIHNINLIVTPDNLSLGESLVAAINLSESTLDEPLVVLFGDTLIKDLPIGEDVVGISQVTDNYDWAVVEDNDLDWLENNNQNIKSKQTQVINGYFKFSQPRQLIRAITQSHWGFLQGVSKYHYDVGLTAISVDEWLDFGHVHTYYSSKATYTTQRAFNELLITPEYIEKSSRNNIKIQAEANWFNSIPVSMRIYIPQYLGSNNQAINQNDNRFSYRLEYLHLTALNELYVFAELPPVIWNKILECCVDFLKRCSVNTAPVNSVVNDFSDLFGIKTQNRLKEYCDNKEFSLEQTWSFNNLDKVSLSDILLASEQNLPKNNWLPSLLHGDFCFSNTLYDFRSNRIKTIDPRGINNNNELTIYGDVRYDIAKLSHSVLGMYDWIMAGYYQVEITNNKKITLEIAGKESHSVIQQEFVQLIEQKFNLSAINLYAMQIQLFLSMLPLHSDDINRQNALFANAFNLYHKMQGLK